VVCSHTGVSQCVAGDGCCPAGCSSFNDSDCVGAGCDGGLALDGGPQTGCP
jgi:hypothetical protein